MIVRCALSMSPTRWRAKPPASDRAVNSRRQIPSLLTVVGWMQCCSSSLAYRRLFIPTASLQIRDMADEKARTQFAQLGGMSVTFKASFSVSTTVRCREVMSWPHNNPWITCKLPSLYSLKSGRRPKNEDKISVCALSKFRHMNLRLTVFPARQISWLSISSSSLRRSAL